MKKQILWIALLSVALLVFSSCESVTNTIPTPNSQEKISGANESPETYPPLTQEALSEIKTHFATEFRKKTSEQYFLPISKETYLSTLESFSLNPDAFYFSRIGELQSYELLSEADLYKMDFQYDYFPSTIIENSYFSSCLTVKNFEKVEKGMTEKEVNGLLGSPFYSYQTEPGMLVTWYAAYLVFGENYSFAPWQITFEKNMTGEYVVTSIENDLAMLLDGLFEVP